ncbi:hypothetical protein D1B31_11510 [Neobacillus notoginsengisoli]|uniref:Uncharacterized protein n=1 Tax=Neobacillus notoginsengisoli TaxID=1578198 RepID=A0A417YUK4_9BACI|nr:hypothetical protein D1B31_11510 [Neobacillus notoginsengisoli]
MVPREDIDPLVPVYGMRGFFVFLQKKKPPEHRRAPLRNSGSGTGFYFAKGKRQGSQPLKKLAGC